MDQKALNHIHAALSNAVRHVVRRSTTPGKQAVHYILTEAEYLAAYNTVAEALGEQPKKASRAA